MTSTVPSSPIPADPGRSEPSDANEIRALAQLAFADARRFPGALMEMHLGIAERAFAGAGPASAPARRVHEAVSRGVYGALAAGTGLLGRAADAVLEHERVGEEVRLSRTRWGSAAIGALNGLIGDELERSSSGLDQGVSVRVEGEEVTLGSEALERAFPQATDRVAVFVHGLMGTEFFWDWDGSERESYGARLAADLGFTPVYVRYNSGRHVSENGRSLAALLERLAAAWPQELRRVALVGHSMGGLVARSACHYGTERGHAWPGLVSHVVSLGTPHLGAPLERGAHVAAVALSSLPETRMLGAFLRRRSAGIRDLRHGSLVDEDWHGRDPEALRAAACKEVPLLRGARHCFVSATITRDPRHPLGRLLGDTLVLVPSAGGRSRTRRIPFADEHGHHVGATHHLELLKHPAVYERLRAWLTEPAREG